MTTGMDITLHFELERETKNTYRFAELNDSGEPAERDEQLIGQLYVQKAFFKNGKPEKIAVTITVED